MSVEWYQIRSTDVDSSTLRYTQLLNKINIGQFSSQQSDNLKRPKILASSTESKVLYQDPFYLAKRHGLYTLHENPTEPNASTLRAWIRFAYIDASIEDLSYFESHANLNGLPLLCPGYNDGVIGLFLASKFNYDRANHLDYAIIPQDVDSPIDIAPMSTGFSFQTLFKPLDFAQHNATNPRIIEYKCNGDGSSWARISMTSTQRLEWIVNDASVNYGIRTDVSALMKRAWYLATVTYDPLATPRQHIYLNTIDHSDISTVSASAPGGSNTDLNIGIHPALDRGACNAVFQEMRLHSRVLSFDEHLNNWFNLRSTDAIPFGGFAVPGYWYIRPDVVPTPDFDTADFDSNDFN